MLKILGAFLGLQCERFFGADPVQQGWLLCRLIFRKITSGRAVGQKLQREGNYRKIVCFGELLW